MKNYMKEDHRRYRSNFCNTGDVRVLYTAAKSPGPLFLIYFSTTLCGG